MLGDYRFGSIRSSGRYLEYPLTSGTSIVLFLIALSFIAGGCSSSSTNGVSGDSDNDDFTPPAVVSDLHVIKVTTTTIQLGWTAPGDDGTSGVAFEYDLRGSYDSITSANFMTAIRIDSVNPPLPAGMFQMVDLEDLQPGQRYYFALKTRDDAGNWSGLSNCVPATCLANEVVIFPDTVLERIVRAKINKPSGDIMVSDIDCVTELGGQAIGIADLTGLQYFSSLELLNLLGNDVVDLNPIESLYSLKILNVNDNHIADISPVANLIALDQLHIGGNPVTDLSPLSGLTGLSILSINSIAATDFTPILSLSGLTSLQISNNPISDMSLLDHLPNLLELSMNFCGISDISKLSSHTNLKYLYLVLNQISDLTPLTNLTALELLNISYNNISDITPLVVNAGIGNGDIIYLSNNPLSELARNTHIPALQSRGVTVHY
ncbi:MAG: leucine-rich repeat domain-containing protein [bacterium]